MQHHFICKVQSAYLKSVALQLPIDNVSVVDCVKNYSFIIQNATQGFHWNVQVKPHCTYLSSTSYHQKFRP
jgi:hypothetical protein